MKYTVNLLRAEDRADTWARQRETEGWHALSVADHIFTGEHTYPHAWVSAAAMVMATTTVTISTAFANNLFRSPVEVAQAALQLQQLSGGRFHLGLGAGWADREVIGSGLRYPDPPERAGRFAESVQIIRALFHDRACSFQGEYYNVEVPMIGPRPDLPPILAASVGGPRTILEVTPHLDRVELKAQSAATKSGSLNLSTMAAISEGHLLEMIDRVRAVDADIPISMFVLLSVGDDSITTSVGKKMRSGGPTGLFRRFFGAPEQVAESFEWLESIGISSVSLSTMSPHTLEALAPHVL